MFVISGISKQRRIWRYPRGNQQYICKVQHVLFALFLFVYVEWCPTLIVLCLCFVCLRLAYPMLLLTRKLLNQRFLLDKLKSSLRTFLSEPMVLCFIIYSLYKVWLRNKICLSERKKKRSYIIWYYHPSLA